MLSFDDLVAALVEAADVHARHVHVGRSPFATDGPWGLIPREELAEYTGGVTETRVPRLKPTRAELAMMRERVEWLLLIPSDDDRRLVVRALAKLAAGHSRVPWRSLVEQRPRWRTPDGLRWRYGKVMTRLCQRVNVALRQGSAAIMAENRR